MAQGPGPGARSSGSRLLRCCASCSGKSRRLRTVKLRRPEVAMAKEGMEAGAGQAGN